MSSRITRRSLLPLTAGALGALTLLPAPSARAEATPAEQREHISRVVPFARAEQEAFGVPASISIAQSIIETGFGTSDLARIANNHHGLKAHRPLSVSVGIYTKESPENTGGPGETVVESDFHRFASAADGFLGHGEWLQASHYAEARKHAHDPYRFLVEIKKAGYATAYDYVEKVWEKVGMFDLTQYDRPAVAPSWTVTKDATAAGFSASASWGTSSWDSQKLGAWYRFSSPRKVSDPARFSVSLPAAGVYRVEVRHPADSGYSAGAPHVLATADGTRTIILDQRTNGGVWRSLGEHRFGAGTQTPLAVSCWTAASGLVIADGMRITRVS